MNGLIKETNENLKSIINTMKENLDSAIEVLENIQTQMDKKVEEAKKYKIQVDTAKENIRNIEEDNRLLELSLNEINEKYSKMNLVSLIEAGNKEIKEKINNNIKDINKNKEEIAELTSKARTIKDLLINMKKDRTAKEEKLENLKAVYEFYSKNINELINYSYENIDNLDSFKYNYHTNEEVVKEDNNTLENTMIFDEIAYIDDNKNFKDEMTFINNEIEKDFSISNEEDTDIDLNELESTKVFDSIIDPDNSYELETETIADDTNDFENSRFINLEIDNKNDIEDTNITNDFKTSNLEDEINAFNHIGFDNEDNSKSFNYDFNNIENNINAEEEKNKEIEIVEDTSENNIENINDFKFDDKLFNNNNIEDNNLNLDDKFNLRDNFSENTQFDLTTNNRINELSELLTNFDSEKELDVNTTEEKNDSTLKTETKDATMLDIFGNPIRTEDIDKSVIEAKKIEELFIENGINFNKFKEDEQNYLKQIYDENKFVGIFNILNKHKINVDNLYHSFNIFGEIDFIELDNIINKLISVGQSIESIGFILEKMPKIKKYNLDEAIASFNDEIKTINITELIMRAKELYNGGNK